MAQTSFILLIMQMRRLSEAFYKNNLPVLKDFRSISRKFNIFQRIMTFTYFGWVPFLLLIENCSSIYSFNPFISCISFGKILLVLIPPVIK